MLLKYLYVHMGARYFNNKIILNRSTSMSLKSLLVERFSGKTMSLSQIRIVLVNTTDPGNIGATAPCDENHGFKTALSG